MKILNYLVIRTPKQKPFQRRLELPDRDARPAGTLFQMPAAVVGQVPSGRIALSLLGVFLGILASFFITDLAPRHSQIAEASNQIAQAEVIKHPPADQERSAGQPKLATEFNWKRFASLFVISIVICMLTYQQLYFSLRLYEQSPTFLILFVSFQYGYFWQSVIKGGTAML